MHTYVLCSTPCAVKLDGNYIGKAGENFSVLPSDEGLAEFIPLSSEYAPTAFILGSKSSQDMKIIDLYGGILLIPNFRRTIFSDFKLIGSKQFDLPGYAVRLTCYAENGVRLIAETAKSTEIENLPFKPDDVAFYCFPRARSAFVGAIAAGKKSAMIFFEATASGLKRAFRQTADGYNAEGNVLTTINFRRDILKHVVTEKWKFADSLLYGGREVTARKKVYSLPEKLFIYAFFEEVAINGDVKSFLSPRLKPRAEDLKSFLGDFRAVLPPPHFKPQDLVTLLYPDRVAYARATVSSGLIDGVTLADD